MPLPPSSRLQLTTDLNICRILNGLWQVSGAHGRIDRERAVDAMFLYHEAGFTSWDLADHYGPAEDLIGEFRRRFAARYGEVRLGEIQAFTKWVPYPGPMTRPIVEQAVNVSLSRMRVDRLDLLQFHWWEYRDGRYLDALKHLCDLRETGKIRHLALTNFDTDHLQQITEHGIRIVSNQVQFSLVDQRPLAGMAAYCDAHDIALLAYGAVLGGLLSEKYLGRTEPQRAELATASLQKYQRMIELWGGWALFQELLAALQQVASKHRAGIANIAVRWVLQQPRVAGVIVGARLGLAQHIEDNARTFGVALDAEDQAALAPVLGRSRDLMRVIGDCGAEYR
jgi:aryl-alcohol dehydrogenase-like predicted oxidoreductase